MDKFNEYINSKDYGTDEISNPKICFGISIDNIKKYGFGILYDTFDKTRLENIFLNDSPKYLILKIVKIKKLKYKLIYNLSNFTK